MSLSLQLYSARNYSSITETFRLLAELQISFVEGYRGLLERPEQTADALAKHGIEMHSAHLLLSQIEADFDGVIAKAARLGIARIYAPYLDAGERPDTHAGWEQFAQRLASAGERLAAHGIRFGWHNHDFEFVPTEDGSVPMRVILETAPEVEWQADLAWIHRAGEDPRAWIDAYGARITAAHVKDAAPAGVTDEDGWCDLGEGEMNWPALLTALRAKGCDLFVLEHDNPADFPRFARRSAKAFRAML